MNYYINMHKCTYPAAVILGAFFILSFSLSAQADNFGSGSNTFSIAFVDVVSRFLYPRNFCFFYFLFFPLSLLLP